MVGKLLTLGRLHAEERSAGELYVKNHLKTWDIERVNKVSLSILRMSVYSLKYQTDIQPSIVIDEAIHIAKEFGPDGSFKFVNAILDNIKKFLNGESAD